MAEIREKAESPRPEECLGTSEFFDFEHPAVVEYIAKNLPDWRELTERERIVRIYYLVRDGWRYNPYVFKWERETFRASFLLQKKKQSYCIPKALLVGALARATGIPARLGFGDVKNHLSSQRLIDYLKSDIFCFHGFTELYVDGAWVRCTPAFDAKLCETFNVTPLEFDGKHDALFHEFDNDGGKFMEYVRYHGVFGDLPYEWLMTGMHREYPHLSRLPVPEGDLIEETPVTVTN